MELRNPAAKHYLTYIGDSAEILRFDMSLDAVVRLSVCGQAPRESDFTTRWTASGESVAESLQFVTSEHGPPKLPH